VTGKECSVIPLLSRRSSFASLACRNIVPLLRTPWEIWRTGGISTECCISKYPRSVDMVRVPLL
jgi:hypothetical protein